MKIGIIGDAHLGDALKMGRPHPTLRVNTRLLDFVNTMKSTIDDMVEDDVETLVFTGDVFEHRRPTIVEQKLFSRVLRYALGKGIKQIYVVVGNHDQQRLGQATTLSYIKELQLPEIKICDEIEMVTLENDMGDPRANLIFMPYRDRKWYGVDSFSEAIDKIRSELTYLLRSIDNNRPVVLVGHMTIEGTFFKEGYQDMYDSNQLFLPKDMFKGINVTLMGHVHEPGVISRDPYIAYVGSMEKTRFFEQHDKVYAVVNMNDASVEFKKEPCRNVFDISFDFSSVAYGDELMDKIFASIDTFAEKIGVEGKTLQSSIVRVPLRISAGDEKYCDVKKIASYLRETHKVFNCLETSPAVFSPRQARDDRITEQISDTEALRLFLDTSEEDPEMRAAIVEAGIEIIKLVEAEHAAR